MTDLTDERLRDNHLIGFLPKGEAAYVRQDNGMWGVAIFAEGTVDRLFTVAADMDKGVAAWVALRINGALASKDATIAACLCDKCAKPILYDLMVSDELWASIAPKPVEGWKGGGLLCPGCILAAAIERLEGERFPHSGMTASEAAGFIDQQEAKHWKARAEAAEAALDDAVKALELAHVLASTARDTRSAPGYPAPDDIQAIVEATRPVRSRTGGANG